MFWWIKARRAHTHLTSAIAVFTLLLSALGDRTVFLPSLANGATASARLSLFVPVVVTSVLMICMESRIHAPEVSGTRRISILDAALAITVVIICTAIGWAVGQPAAGRNVLFLTGLLFTARAIVGKAAVMVPIAWLMTVLFVGFRTASDPYPWTIVPEPTDATHAVIAALVMFTVGISCLLRTARNAE
ncbi:hypothetical protein AB0D30_41475 [Streptomyces sp. NPDC048409]|uniref:hypothetical protein n=1 Tax=Streptomyces sp. NPDC048409 TaxID=3154723 RepID=UPI00342B3DF2